MKSYDWHNVRARLSEALRFVPTFAAHPARGMRTLPDWDWPTVLILQAAFAAATASLTALVGHNWVLVITSLIVAPITYLVVNAIASGFFYYVYKFAFARDVPFRQIYLASTFASLPGQILMVVAPLFPPVMVLGAALYSGLIYIASVDVYHASRVGMRNLLVALLLIYAGLTAQTYLKTKHHRVQLKERASPASMDILEKELED